MKELQLNELSLAFSDSLEHTAQFCSSVIAQQRFMSWSTMTALSICFHHFTASAALLRNRINCIGALF